MLIVHNIHLKLETLQSLSIVLGVFTHPRKQGVVVGEKNTKNSGSTYKYNVDLYKPPTARCESAPTPKKIEKLETAEKRTWQTNPGEKRFGTFARYYILAYFSVFSRRVPDAAVASL